MARVRTFQLFSRQMEVIKALEDNDAVMVVAGQYGGKSFVGTERAYDIGVNYAVARAWYVSGTHKLHKAAYNFLKSWGYADETLWHIDGQHNTLYFITGSYVAMQTAERWYRLRADHLDLVVIDEMSVFTEDAIEGALGRASRKGARRLLLGNAPSPNEPGFGVMHKYFREWQDRPRHAVLHWPSWDNYLKYPGGEADPQVEAERQNNSPGYFRRMFAADMSIRAGLVYPSFNRERHVIQGPYTPTGRVYIFGDYGMNTACILWADWDGQRLVVFKEFYRPDMISPKVAEHFVAGTLALGMTPQQIRDSHIDPANKDLKVQVAAKGFNVDRFGKVDKRDKVQLVDRTERWFDQNADDGVPKIRITSECEHTIWECENLVVDKGGVLPKDGQPNHATDCVQYGECGIEGPAGRAGQILSGKGVSLHSGGPKPPEGMVPI